MRRQVGGTLKILRSAASLFHTCLNLHVDVGRPVTINALWPIDLTFEKDVRMCGFFL